MMITVIFWIGVTLSIGAFVLLLGLIVDVLRRRTAFPSLHHGALTVSGRMMQAVWIIGAVAAFGGSLTQDVLVLERTFVNGQPALGEVWMELPSDRHDTGIEARVERSTRLPFYQSRYQTVRYEGQQSQRHIEQRRLMAPLSFLLVVLLYWAFIVRNSTRKSEAGSGAQAGLGD
jgi:hypothetical protein